MVFLCVLCFSGYKSFLLVMTVDFCDYFWGEKNNGFDVLYQNTKHGHIACKELADFFKERAVLEENYSKTLIKLANRASNAGSSGTFSPLWIILRMATERMASVHTTIVARITDLVKEVQKYMDDLHKRQKSLKEEEGPTMDITQTIQHLTIATSKAKELYQLRANEMRKAQEAGLPVRDLEKADVKYKKSAEDYRNLVERYGTVRHEFERKMVISCRHFQELEENYLCQMKEFLENYVKICEDSHMQAGEIHSELRLKTDEKSIIKLLEEFALNKHTGLEKPVVLEFDEIPMPVPPPNNAPSSENVNDVATSNEVICGPPPSSGTISRQGFLRGRRGRQTKQIKKKEAEKDIKSDGEDSKTSPEIDEEGYSIRPPQSQEKKTRHNSFSSSDDTDSDNEMMSRIHVKIKPLDNGAPISASVDELRHLASGLTLSSSAMNKSPSPHCDDAQLRRSQSVSQQLGRNRAANDLIGLGLASPTRSHDSVPSAAISASQQDLPPLLNNPGSTDRYADLREMFDESSDVPPSLPPKHQLSHPTSASHTTSSVVIPRPPSRRSADGMSGTLRSHASPSQASMHSSRSITPSPVSSTVTRRTDGVVSASRGPSPLTLSLNDTVPLAVAFQEVVHSYFHGSEPSRCQVKMTGDIMVSFPSGIVQVLARNTSPTPLVFCIKHPRKLDGLVPNRHLLIQDQNRTTTENTVFEFRMENLAKLLKLQTEKNPKASYFNVDIVKYQISAQPGSGSAPVHLVAYWKCEPAHTDLKIEYKVHSSAMVGSCSVQNLAVAVPVDGGVVAMHSKPVGRWVADSTRAIWSIPELAATGPAAAGTLKARFELSHGPGTPSTLAAQFCCEGATLSGAQFQLLGSGYRLSLVKRRVVAGKYLCDSDFIESGERYAAPPGAP